MKQSKRILAHATLATTLVAALVCTPVWAAWAAEGADSAESNLDTQQSINSATENGSDPNASDLGAQVPSKLIARLVAIDPNDPTEDLPIIKAEVPTKVAAAVDVDIVNSEFKSGVASEVEVKNLKGSTLPIKVDVIKVVDSSSVVGGKGALSYINVDLLEVASKATSENPEVLGTGKVVISADDPAQVSTLPATLIDRIDPPEKGVENPVIGTIKTSVTGKVNPFFPTKNLKVPVGEYNTSILMKVRGVFEDPIDG